MAPEKRRLSFWEKCILYYGLTRSLNSYIIAYITGPFRARKLRRKILDHHAFLAFNRQFIVSTTTPIIQHLMPSCASAYHTLQNTRSFPPRIESLPSGLQCYWMGPAFPSGPDATAAKGVVIWFCGGGYNIPPSMQHLRFLTHIREKLPDVAVLVPAYSLVPVTYPQQLKEGVEALRYVLHTLDVSPTKICVAGDSAGGNLALGVLSHVLHPHPEIEPLRLLKDGIYSYLPKLDSLLLMSPWCSFNMKAKVDPMYDLNKEKDLVDDRIGKKWASAFLGGKEGDAYSESLRTRDEKGWWDRLPGLIDQVWMSAGEDEVLLASIQEMKEVLAESHPKVELLSAPGEWHENACQDRPPDEVGISRDGTVKFLSGRFEHH